MARRIAAGEVIDRPAAVLRELIDNSIDAGADNIDAHIQAGGVSSIRIIDNGFGMTADDLKKCVLPHATSKIRTLEDLNSSMTLGFRGEALSSISACSRLTILSKHKDEGIPHRLIVKGGKIESFEIAAGTLGTVVDVADIFYAMPARRKFLRSTAGETTACRNVFIDKSLPFPSISFRFYSAGAQKIMLSKGTLLERTATIFKSLGNTDFWCECSFPCLDGNAHIVYLQPPISRSDRRYMRTFLNNRRIDDYSLLKTLELAFSETLPGGRFPVVCLFLEIPPEQVDFNIHPAKREARIRQFIELKDVIRSKLRSELRKYAIRLDNKNETEPSSVAAENANFLWKPSSGYQKGSSTTDSVQSSHARNESNDAQVGKPFVGKKSDAWASFIKTAGKGRRPESEKASAAIYNEPLRYIGRFAQLFIIVAKEEALFLIDQHAAHERIIYNSLQNNSYSPSTLLVPLSFKLDPDYDTILNQKLEAFEEIGISFIHNGPGEWTLHALAECYDGHEDTVVRFLQEGQIDADDVIQYFLSEIACKKAIKDGEFLDDISALSLAEQALNLPDAHCPHGRPIWFSLSKSELFALVGRT